MSMPKSWSDALNTPAILHIHTYVCMNDAQGGLDAMSMQGILTLRCLGWADMLTTGIDERQLRGAIDRSLIDLGEKGPNGRLMFSVSERFAAQVAHELTKMELPIRLASFVANKVLTNSNALLNYHLKHGCQKQGTGSLSLYIYNDGGDFVVVYAVGDQQYEPGRGVSNTLMRARAAIIVDLSDLLNEMGTWADTLSKSEGNAA